MRNEDFYYLNNLSGLESKFTSFFFLLLGVPQGFSPPEKLGKLRHTIDLMLHVKREES